MSQLAGLAIVVICVVSITRRCLGKSGLDGWWDVLIGVLFVVAALTWLGDERTWQAIYCGFGMWATYDGATVIERRRVTRTLRRIGIEYQFRAAGEDTP